MSIKLSTIESDSNYVATIVKLPELKAVDGLDNLMVANIFGYNCLVGKDSNPNDLYIFFPAETVLSHNFLEVNCLYRDSSKNIWKDKKWFFEDSGRVKAVKFKGIVSSGFLCPISFLHQFATDLKVGDTFHAINGVEVCKKFRRPLAPEHLTKSQRISKRLEKFDIVIPNQFRFHADTPQFLRFIGDFKSWDRVTITEKLHWTSAVFSNVMTIRKLSFLETLSKWLWARIEDRTYYNLYSSRTVIKNDDIRDPRNVGNGYYWEDIWGIYAKLLEPKIEKGLTLYGEIVGYTPSGAYIQQGYSYGCKEGESKFYVYRMTYTTPDGVVIEFTDSQIRQYCGAREIEVVPEVASYIQMWVIDVNSPWWKAVIDEIEIMCPMNDGKVPREGVVIRRDGKESYSAYKLKSQLFLGYETAEIDKGSVDTEEAN